MGLCFTALLLGLLLLLSSFPTQSTAQPFQCSTLNSTCRSLVDYASPNSTTLSSIKTLFNVKNLRTILGANSLPLSTPQNTTVTAHQTIKIPFQCACLGNRTGASNRRPIYTVQSGDTLYHIAAEIFSSLVTYEQIAAFNNVPDVNLIEVGQKLWVPLPCGCDDVDGEKVVHYGHVVEAGSTLELIAEEYGTSSETLLRLNGLANASSLLAGQVLDVPLKACNSSIRTDSLDYPLLVSNGTYVHTANNCIMCKCDAANNWTLQCEPSQVRPSNWDSCPTMQCEGNLYIGNTTSNGCSRSSCAYAGYSTANQTIFTTLLTESTCASPPAPGNYASKMQLSWNLIFIPFHLIMLFQYLSL
ncbi:lysM domain-containing GPI-anchored protein 2 isoform X1 [Tripterygium wilfordii]|uniref:lysM domain-containing GPI-anchored protein 2 isoform X1 n=1 Tax=Tripterygium wilfordii TaxID=458696 RepID=UPI0018F84260|nr:lysM domain-containing GPI-anchored protein 2 isoform X1 [Tripterygium wilfordii]